MPKRPSLKDQLSAQRTASAAAQNSSVADTFRKDEAEARFRTSMYLPESLARRLKLRALEEEVRSNDIVVKALEQYLDAADNNSAKAS